VPDAPAQFAQRRTKSACRLGRTRVQVHWNASNPVVNLWESTTMRAWKLLCMAGIALAPGIAFAADAQPAAFT
jgi:hypothetical protein